MKGLIRKSTSLLAIATLAAMAGCVDPPAQVQSSDKDGISAAASSPVLPKPAVNAVPDTSSQKDAADTGKIAAAQNPDAAERLANAPEDDTEVDQTIDNVLGDHAAYRDVFDRLQKAMAANDKTAVAALVAYPIDVRVAAKPKAIHNAQELIAHWDGTFTAQIQKAIADQKFSKALVNATSGVMIGEGQIWINGICRDEKCTATDVRISAIQEVSN